MKRLRSVTDEMFHLKVVVIKFTFSFRFVAMVKRLICCNTHAVIEIYFEIVNFVIKSHNLKITLTTKLVKTVITTGIV